MDTRKGGRSSFKVPMTGHKSCKRSNLHYNLTSQYSLAAFICVLMFPYLTNHFVLASFPYVWASLCNPKCLFVVVNVIVIFLVGESRAGASTGTASPVNEIYEEYVKRGRRMKRSAEMKKLPHDQEGEKRAEAAGGRRLVIIGGGEEEKEIEEKMVVENEEELKGEAKQKEAEKRAVHENEEEENKHKEKQKEEEQEGKEILVIDEDEEEKKGEEKKETKDKEGESELMPREELNMRVEAFIARVNKQRQMESKLVSIRPASLPWLIN